MRKVLALTFVLAVVGLAAACGDKTKTGDTTTPASGTR